VLPAGAQRQALAARYLAVAKAGPAPVGELLVNELALRYVE
jgi:hypothetical protein